MLPLLLPLLLQLHLLMLSRSQVTTLQDWTRPQARVLVMGRKWIGRGAVVIG